MDSDDEASEEDDEEEGDTEASNSVVETQSQVVVDIPTDSQVLAEIQLKYEEMATKNEALSAENDQLQIIINDLARRLQNAQYTIDAQRNISIDSIGKATMAKKELEVVSRRFQLEIAKSASSQRKQLKNEEARKYEIEKKRNEKYQEDLRFAIIDHSMTGRPKEPISLGKLRKKVEETEQKQDSLKALVSFYYIIHDALFLSLTIELLAPAFLPSRKDD